MNTEKRNLEDLKTKANQDGKVIGSLVWWGLDEIKVMRDVIVEEFIKVNLDKKYIPEIKKEKAFTKSVKVIGDKKVGVERINDDSNSLIYCIVDKDIDKEKKDINFSTIAKFIFNKEDETVEIKIVKPEVESLREIFNSNYSFNNSYYNTDDVRAIILKIISDLNPINVRERGGIYFISIEYKDIIINIEKVLNKISPTSSFFIFDIISSEESKKGLNKALFEEVQIDIERIVEEMKEIEGDDNDNKYKNMLLKFRNIKDKVDFYENAIEFKMQDIKEKITNLTNDIINGMKTKVKLEDIKAKISDGSIRDFVLNILKDKEKQNLNYEKIATTVREKFGSNTSTSSIAWYASKFKEDILPRIKIKKSKEKKDEMVNKIKKEKVKKGKVKKIVKKKSTSKVIQKYVRPKTISKKKKIRMQKIEKRKQENKLQGDNN